VNNTDREPLTRFRRPTVVISRGFVLFALAATLPAGCTFGTEAPSGGTATAQPRAAPRPQLTRYRGHGITFTYPASWRCRHRGFYTTMTSPVVDLATQPTRNPCTAQGCWFPVRHLQPGAVVVMWNTGGGLMVPAHPPMPGVHVTVLRRGCRVLGGDEELTARVVLRGGRIYEAAACIRAPGVSAHEREVRAMLASARRTDS
jgi:hypothetical protein